MVRVKVLLFAEARERAESDFLWVELESETTTQTLLETIGLACTELVSLLLTCQLAHNHVRTVNE